MMSFARVRIERTRSIHPFEKSMIRLVCGTRLPAGTNREVSFVTETRGLPTVKLTTQNQFPRTGEARPAKCGHEQRDIPASRKRDQGRHRHAAWKPRFFAQRFCGRLFIPPSIALEFGGYHSPNSQVLDDTAGLQSSGNRVYLSINLGRFRALKC